MRDEKLLRIVNDTGVAYGTKVVDERTGSEIKGISRLAIVASGEDGKITAEVTICSVNVDVVAASSFMIAHPTTGKLVPVASITLADGEVLTF